MRTVSEVTKLYNTKTVVSLNSLMTDGTRLCGCCCVTAGGKMKFACVDGPEFDAHLVDFDEFRAKIHTCDLEERAALEHHEGGGRCKS